MAAFEETIDADPLWDDDMRAEALAAWRAEWLVARLELLERLREYARPVLGAETVH